MVDNAPIEEARRLILGCIELVELEPQQDFLQMRLHTDLCKALDALEAIQTVVLPPPPRVVDLSEIDDGEPVCYETEHNEGMHIIREANKVTMVVGKPPQSFPVTHRTEFGKMEVDYGHED